MLLGEKLAYFIEKGSIPDSIERLIDIEEDWRQYFFSLKFTLMVSAPLPCEVCCGSQAQNQTDGFK